MTIPGTVYICQINISLMLILFPKVSPDVSSSCWSVVGELLSNPLCLSSDHFLMFTPAPNDCEIAWCSVRNLFVGRCMELL